MVSYYVAIVEVTPDDVEIDFGKLLTDLKNSLPECASYLKHEQIPIAFGLEKLRLQVKFSDELTNADPIEDAWNQIDGVQRVETIMVSKA